MRFKSTIFLAVILIALCSYLYFIERPSNEKKKKEEEAKQALFSFSESDIAELTITGSGQSLSLIQLSGHPETPWKISEPLDTVADENTASSFASQLSHLEIIRKVDDNPSDLTPFGLNPPAYSVRIILKGLNNDLLEIGSDGITGNDLYARVGNAVYLVESGIKRYLSKPLKDWRRQELFKFVSSDVKSIQIEGVENKINLVKEKEDWLIGGDKADPSKVFNFLGSLSSLRGEEFIDENKVEKIAALGSPFFRVKLAVGAGLVEGAFYKESESIYAVTNPNAPLYKISSKQFEGIDKPMSYFKKDLP